MRNTGIQLRVGDLLYALQKRWLLIVGLTFLGLVFGLLLSGLTYVQESVQLYNVTGSVAITTKTGQDTYLGGMKEPASADYHLAEEMTSAVVYVMRSERVIDALINERALLGVTISDVRSSLSISQEGSTQILKVRLAWPTAEEGLAMWQSLITISNELLPQVLMLGHLELINEPVAAAAAQSSSVSSMSMLFALIGFAAGAGFAVMELLMHPTLTNVKDVETIFGLETLGIIPKDPEFFRRKTSLLVKDEIGSSEVLQNYASSAYILRNRLNAREQHHCFYVTSAIKREGRTSVATNLAIQLSDMEHRTLLVDFDTHNPSLGSLFLNNVDYNASLNALYRGEINENDAITTLTGYLDLLPMVLEHGSISMDGTIVDLITRLKERYEYVIIDAPPVGTESETLSLNQVANSVVFVIGYDNASMPEIQSSLEKLDKSGIRVIGCIVNAAKGSRFTLNVDEDGKKRVTTKRQKKLKEKAFLDPDAEKADEHTKEMLKSNAKVETEKKKPRRSRRKKKQQEAEAVPEQTPAPKRTELATPMSILEELSVPENNEKKQVLSAQKLAEAILQEQEEAEAARTDGTEPEAAPKTEEDDGKA